MNFTHSNCSRYQPTSLHETSDLILAIEVLIVEITLMLKAVENYRYNKKKKTLQHRGRPHLEQYVFDAFMTVFCVFELRHPRCVC
jgi:hypothetical protein